VGAGAGLFCATAPAVSLATLLPTTVIEAMNELESYGDATPFDWIDRSSIYAHWHALRQLADLPEWCRPHTLRKTAASHCATLEEAARLLGHASPATTLRSYRDPRVVKATAEQSELAKALERPRRSWLRRLGWTG
jgi:integrase